MVKGKIKTSQVSAYVVPLLLFVWFFILKAAGPFSVTVPALPGSCFCFFPV